MKRIIILSLFLTIVCLPFCTTTKKAAGDNKMTETTVSYTTDVAPIIQERCSPCHYPGGKKKLLDTYAAVSENIDDIIHRVELPVDADGFMPFKSKKEPLSDSLIYVIQLWKTQQMPK
jgi:hypothetical protein